MLIMQHRSYHIKSRDAMPCLCHRAAVAVWLFLKILYQITSLLDAKNNKHYSSGSSRITKLNKDRDKICRA
jgi:hypothetical protein